jgi:heavy metal sensor kinase
MTLSTRLLAFFLSVLAAVLVAFSVALWFVSRSYLSSRVDDQLSSALDVLAAAVELAPDGVEWEPNEKPPQGDAREAALVWSVVDENGRTVDSDGEDAAPGVLDQARALSKSAGSRDVLSSDGTGWRLARIEMPGARSADRPSESLRPPDAPKFASLVITAGVSLGPTEAILRTLAAAAGGISLALWLLVALAGRALTRRALAPLTAMSEAVRSIRPSELGRRVPVPAARDEVHDLGEAFNGLLDKLQEAFARQQRFTGDASHQLRTPLTAMLGQVEVALRRERSGENYQKVLGDLKSQIVRVQQIVEALLFLARAEGEAHIPDRQVVDLREWAADHLRNWSSHPRASDFRVESDADAPLPVNVHAPLLGQLFDNLLDNACKYSEAGTQVTIRTSAAGPSCRLSIADAGRGIPAEELPRVFEPFYRTARSRRDGRNGTGLGLAVAQRIASAFGGRIAVDSREQRGTTFTIELPRG